jgi:hypothetical protein
LPERLAIWFGVGTGSLALFAFAGIVLRARLSHLALVLAGIYGLLVILVAAKRILKAGPGTAAGIDAGHSDGARGDAGPGTTRIIVVAVIGLAIAAGLITLLTPRDGDDWYYLAYIRDYASDHAIASEDAIFNMGSPASPRAWYGAWWVLEAFYSRTAGIDPIACHRVYLPVVVACFGTLATFAFAKQIFRSDRTALTAASLQVIFYLSNLFPSNTPGWMFFCRASQDKATALMVMFPVTAALALAASHGGVKVRLLSRSSGFFVYGVALVSSALVHPLAPIWSGLAIVPFLLVELIRGRDNARRFCLMCLPFLVCALIVMSGHEAITEGEGSSEYRVEATTERWSGLDFHLPGDAFPTATGDFPYARVMRLSENLWLTNPTYVIRFPFAVADLILTVALIFYSKTDSAARFLLVLTASVLLATYAPGGTWLMPTRPPTGLRDRWTGSYEDRSWPGPLSMGPPLRVFSRRRSTISSSKPALRLQVQSAGKIPGSHSSTATTGMCSGRSIGLSYRRHALPNRP